MPISDIVNVQITASSTGVAQAGFGVPMILSPNVSWIERTRTYSGIDGVALDFAATTPEYRAANAAFSQNPRPASIMIGRLANKPTQRRTITPVAVNSAVYTIRVGTATFSFTADSSATQAEIVTGLIALINAGTDNLTATGTTTLVLTADTAGGWDDVQVSDITLLSLAQDHADPGVTADLDAIALEDSTWYGIINLYNSAAMVTAIAAWAESHGKIFLYATQDSKCALDAFSGATDIMKTLNTSAYARTAGMYHPSNGAFADAAWAGRCLPLQPGSETWALKTLAGVAATKLTDTWRTNILAKRGNIYVTLAGRNITEFGTVADNEYIDVVRFSDWLKARIAESVFGALSDALNAKVPYTDRGIAALAAEVRGVLKEGADVGGLVADSIVVSVPKAADALPADKTARVLKNLNFSATLQGAIHRADPIKGTVSV
jgi:hypothetical protein